MQPTTWVTVEQLCVTLSFVVFWACFNLIITDGF